MNSSHVESEANRPFSVYVHVPFCTVRCGYCDFNTYTTGFGPGADRASFADSVLAEMDFAQATLTDSGMPPRLVSTVFFGGGTPTLLSPFDLARILRGIKDRWGLVPDAEVTTEANPETVTKESLFALAEAGFTRVSVGMQSAVPGVLATLDRAHKPERVPRVVAWAKEAGLDTSVDLIYGTPGESLTDWERSVRAAIAMEPDHISAYALTVEKGTKMGRQVARGELPCVDPDDEAEKYERADRLFTEAGYRWYEISNFARVGNDEKETGGTDLRHASRHNLAYWRDWDWWGFGPGAHSHVGRYRWWNVKHPRTYAARLAAGESPADDGEILDAQTREFERLLLAIRTSEGVQCQDSMSVETIGELIADGLIEGADAIGGRIRLTLRGRLLADFVTRRLVD